MLRLLVALFHFSGVSRTLLANAEDLLQPPAPPPPPPPVVLPPPFLPPADVSLEEAVAARLAQARAKGSPVKIPPPKGPMIVPSSSANKKVEKLEDTVAKGAAIRGTAAAEVEVVSAGSAEELSRSSEQEEEKNKSVAAASGARSSSSAFMATNNKKLEEHDPDPVKRETSSTVDGSFVFDRVSDSSAAWRHFELLNALRKEGFTCPGGQHFPPNDTPLRFDCRLYQASYDYSKSMATHEFFAHISPVDGTDPFDRSLKYGFPTFSENLAAGQQDPAKTLDQWKNSDGHCTNMMKAGHNRIGVGYYNGGAGTKYRHYWTELLGSSNDENDLDNSCYKKNSENNSNSGDASTNNNSGEEDTTSSESEDFCADQDENCGWWMSLDYCLESSAYQPFMQDTCPKSCGFCDDSAGNNEEAPQTTDPPVVVPIVCEDQDNFCFIWELMGYCEADSSYQEWMGDNCAKSCKECN